MPEPLPNDRSRIPNRLLILSLVVFAACAKTEPPEADPEEIDRAVQQANDRANTVTNKS